MDELRQSITRMTPLPDGPRRSPGGPLVSRAIFAQAAPALPRIFAVEAREHLRRRLRDLWKGGPVTGLAASGFRAPADNGVVQCLNCRRCSASLLGGADLRHEQQSGG